MDRPTTYLYNCEFCCEVNTWELMYWVQGKSYGIDEPNCCADCVEEQDDDSDDE